MNLEEIIRFREYTILEEIVKEAFSGEEYKKINSEIIDTGKHFEILINGAKRFEVDYGFVH